ncbi:putative thiazole biosynthesis enzyme [delta proteobacterium NaphS2]|nr:putative thiazole biosynthesis enzyme [delta proteobacterium NaphS2]
MLDDTTISRLIIKSYTSKLNATLELDVALVGAGPANMTAGYYLGKAGLKAAVFESKLAPGGGMWGGGMMFNEAVLQSDATPVAREIGIELEDQGNGYFTFDTVLAASMLSARCIQSGTRIINCVHVEDVMFREADGEKRVCGLVINWSPIRKLDLPVDPLSIHANYSH